MSLSDIEVFEYGFSHAVWTLCPESWKKALGDDWEKVLKIIISKYSPETYLGRDGRIEKECDYRYQFPAQIAALKRRMKLEQEVEFDSLLTIINVYIVKIGRETVLSKFNPKQKLLDRLGLALEVEWRPSDKAPGRIHALHSGFEEPAESEI